MLFDRKKGTPNPVNILREHISTFLFQVKTGRAKFNDKKEIGKIFRELEGAKFLLEQATASTMYDYTRKLERNVWAAAMQKYGELLQELKEAMLRAADACEARKSLEEAESQEEEALRAEEEALSIREQMEREEARHREEEDAEMELPSGGEEMTEADCRELWKIYRSMNEEYRQMKKTADKWIAENPDDGCLPMAVLGLTVPAAAVYTLFHFL